MVRVLCHCFSIAALAISAAGADDPGSETAVIETAFKTWEERSKKIECVEAVFDRYSYGIGIGRETRSTGHLFAARPNRVRVDICPVEIGPAEKSTRTDSHGRPLKITTVDEASSSIMTERSIQIVRPDANERTRVGIPPHISLGFAYEYFMRREFSLGFFRLSVPSLGRMYGAPVCFIFGPPEVELRSYWDWSLGEQHSWDADSLNTGVVHLRGRPNQQGIDHGFQTEIEVLLDGEHFFPKAVRFREGESTSDSEVFVFGLPSVRANQSWSQANPFDVTTAEKNLLSQKNAGVERGVAGNIDNPDSP